MPANREIAANEAARASSQAGLESLLSRAGGQAMGDGRYGFAAPDVDISSDIEAKREAIAKKRKEDLALIRAGLMQRVRHPVGQEATHVNTGMSAEAGFFAPGLVMDTFAPPGTVEAGHRRPGDYDPVREREYALAYQNQLLGR